MKKNVLFLLFALFFASCSSVQVLEVQSSQVENYEDDVFAYENEDLAIAYDFWTEGGVLLFNITNKSDQDLYIDFSKSIFEINNERYDFYTDLYGVAVNIPQEAFILPPKIEKIPAQSSEVIEGFPVTFRWQKLGRNHKAEGYVEGNSPFQFSNRLIYSFDESFDKEKQLENEFYVSYIEKMKRKEFKAYARNDLPKSHKFYVKRQDQSSNGWIWIDVGLAVIEAVIFIAN